MAHHGACAYAKNPGCTCSGCGGSLHGWPGHLGLAEDPPEARENRRERAEREWHDAVGTDDQVRRRRLTVPTERMLRQATAMARVDIAGHLAARPTTAKRIRELGGLLHERALVRIEAEADRRATERPELAQVSRSLPGHFWCSLLAALVTTADRWERTLDKVPEHARESLEQDTPPDVNPAQDLIADTAVEEVWLCAAVFLGAWGPEELLLVMRVLAVLICPDPGRHPDLVRRCLLPLGRNVLGETTSMLVHQSL